MDAHDRRLELNKLTVQNSVVVHFIGILGSAGRVTTSARVYEVQEMTTSVVFRSQRSLECMISEKKHLSQENDPTSLHLVYSLLGKDTNLI